VAARIMTNRSIGFALACCLVAAADDRASSRESAGSAQGVTLDTVLAAYRSGDSGIVARTFATSRDFPDRLGLARPRDLDRWLGPWDRAKSVLLLELAHVAARVAPRYAAVLVSVGRRYLDSARGDDSASGDTAAFVRTWHRVAAGLLQSVGTSSQVEEYADAGGPDPRLVLARAIAHERNCWHARPALVQPGPGVEALARAAGVTIADDLDGPSRSRRRASVAAHRACLDQAVTRFEAAAGHDETRAEARVRHGWIHFQVGRFPDALNRLDVVESSDDRDLAYWLALFRGRVLSALGRNQDAATAYRAALALYPGAQSAGTGLAVELMRLNRVTEADEIARAVRTAQASAAPDPWSSYLDGDRRFVDRWIAQLRAVIQ
jgi:tetratricopeptide (TPR) repeat protein